MPACDANNDRWLADRHEPDAVAEENFSHLKFLPSAFRDGSHLMFRHGAMGFVFNPRNLPAFFSPAHRTPKNDNRSGARIVSRPGQIERRVGK